MNSNDTSVKKKLCISSMVLGIVGIVFSAILPAVTYSCSIPGLVIAFNKKKKNYNTLAGTVLNIVAVSLALINSILGVIITVKMFLDSEAQEKAE
jgi:hypothetical protein